MGSTAAVVLRVLRVERCPNYKHTLLMSAWACKDSQLITLIANVWHSCMLCSLLKPSFMEEIAIPMVTLAGCSSGLGRAQPRAENTHSRKLQFSRDLKL